MAASVADQLMQAYTQVDAVVKPFVFEGLKTAGFEISPAASTIDLPIVESPTPLLLSLAGYFAIVGSGLMYRKIAPRDNKVRNCQSLSAGKLP